MLRRRFLLSALILAGLGIITYSRFQVIEAQTTDCPVTVVTTNGNAVPNDQGAFVATAENTIVLCFDSAAQAARHRTDGAIDFPDDVSPEVLEAAEAAYYEELSASNK